MNIPDEVRNQARDASDLLELLVRDCANVLYERERKEHDTVRTNAFSLERGLVLLEVRQAILARYGLTEDSPTQASREKVKS